MAKLQHFPSVFYRHLKVCVGECVCVQSSEWGNSIAWKRHWMRHGNNGVALWKQSEILMTSCRCWWMKRGFSHYRRALRSSSLAVQKNVQLPFMDGWPRHGADEASESDARVSKIASEIKPNTATTPPISLTAFSQPGRFDGQIEPPNRLFISRICRRSAGESDGWAQAVIFRRPKASISGKVMTKEMWIVDASLHTTIVITAVPQQPHRKALVETTAV